MPADIGAVRAALAAGAAPVIVNAGPNISTGVSLTSEIAWSTTAPIPQPTPVADSFSRLMAGTPTTFVTVTPTATAVKRAVGDDLELVEDSGNDAADGNLDSIEDSGNDAADSSSPDVEVVETLHPDDVAAGFDPSDPDIEIAESLHNPGDEKKAPYVIGGGKDENGQAAPPIATKVAGAFGPGHVPAHPDDFNINKGPVAPNFRHRQKDKSAMRKAQKGKSKQALKKLQEERKAYLAKLEAEAAAAAAAAPGA